MADAQLELLVEPFKESEPGPHVTAVVAVLEEAGLSAEMGPFSTTVDGDLDVLLGVIGRVSEAAFEAGATRIRIGLERR